MSRKHEDKKKEAAGQSIDHPVENNNEIAILQVEIERLKDQALRALADGENTKRRALADAEKREKYAVAVFARDILPVADSLERALAAARDDGPLKDGIAMTLSTLIAALARFDVRPMESLGKTFDPNFHQVVQEIERDDSDQPAGTIVQEWQKGYTIGDRVLREATVVVAK